MTDIIPHLVVGGSTSDGELCAMQMVSWTLDPSNKTMWPKCSDPTLTLLVQHLNDYYCHISHVSIDPNKNYHADICPSCAQKILKLAFRTIGTRHPDDNRPHNFTSELAQCVDLHASEKAVELGLKDFVYPTIVAPTEAEAEMFYQVVEAIINDKIAALGDLYQETEAPAELLSV